MEKQTHSESAPESEIFLTKYKNLIIGVLVLSAAIACTAIENWDKIIEQKNSIIDKVSQCFDGPPQN